MVIPQLLTQGWWKENYSMAHAGLIRSFKIKRKKFSKKMANHGQGEIYETGKPWFQLVCQCKMSWEKIWKRAEMWCCVRITSLATLKVVFGHGTEKENEKKNMIKKNNKLLQQYCSKFFSKNMSRVMKNTRNNWK